MTSNQRVKRFQIVVAGQEREERESVCVRKRDRCCWMEEKKKTLAGEGDEEKETPMG